MREARYAGSSLDAIARAPTLRGLHSFTFQLNISAFCGIGGVFIGCFGAV